MLTAAGTKVLISDKREKEGLYIIYNKPEQRSEVIQTT